MTRRRHRRLLVVAALALTALMASSLPGSLRGLGIVATLVLAALDVLLVRATGGLAFTRGHRLDERQAGRRDRAFRLGFRSLGLGVVLLVVIAGVTRSAAQADASQLDTGVSARVLVTLLELVVMLPTFVLAWSEPDGGDEPEPRGGLAWAPLVALPLIAAAWLLIVAFAPMQTAAATFTASHGELSVQGASCRHVAAGRIVGAQFGATVGVRVEVCWNGHQAFVFGDPANPPPLGTLPDPFPPMMPAEPSLTACGADSQDDFAAVSGTRCTATTGADGTLHYTVRARVTPLPAGIGARDVTLGVVVTRDGGVLEAP